MIDRRRALARITAAAAAAVVAPELLTQEAPAFPNDEPRVTVRDPGAHPTIELDPVVITRAEMFRDVAYCHVGAIGGGGRSFPVRDDVRHRFEFEGRDARGHWYRGDVVVRESDLARRLFLAYRAGTATQLTLGHAMPLASPVMAWSFRWVIGEQR